MTVPLSQSERYVAFALASAELLIETSVDGTITYAAGAFDRYFGAPAASHLHRPLFDIVTPEDHAALEAKLFLLAGGGRLAPAPIRLATAQQPPMLLSGVPVTGPDGAMHLCLHVARLPDAEPAPHLVASRTAFAGLVTARMAESRDGVATLGLIEMTGPQGPLSPHREVMEELSQALSRKSGAVRFGELSQGRYGVIPEDPEADMATMAGQIERLLSQQGVLARVGATALPVSQSGLTPAQTTRALRHALLAFAQGGAGHLSGAGFDDGLRGFVSAATTKAEAMRRAFSAGRFRMVYQPIVGLTDRRTHHYEALIRPVPTPELPITAPQEMVTFAEAVGLSEEMDAAVLNTTIRVLRRRRDVSIAANLSGLSLQSQGFREHLMALLDAEPWLSSHLLIEITETAEIAQMEEAVATVKALRDRGVAVCLDDFGAGAAAFHYLRSFTVDCVKLDGIYVHGAVRSPRDRGFIQAIQGLASRLGASVVAEQVETEEECALMREIGVDYGQGRLFGSPCDLPA